MHALKCTRTRMHEEDFGGDASTRVWRITLPMKKGGEREMADYKADKMRVKVQIHGEKPLGILSMKSLGIIKRFLKALLPCLGSFQTLYCITRNMVYKKCIFP